MSSDFEKLDKWMMEALRKERENPVSANDLEDFHEKVMNKIASRRLHSAGTPSLGLAFAAALSLAVIFGAVLYFQMIPTQKEKREETLPQAQIASPPKIAARSHDKVISQPAPVIIASKPTLLSRSEALPSPKREAGEANSVYKQTMTESEILNEIEALKELGVWTEEDEEAAGIPVEISFSDLEMFFETPHTSPSAPSLA